MRTMRRLIQNSVVTLAAFTLAGCAGRASANYPMNTLEPRSDLAQWIISLYIQVTIWDALIFVIVVVALSLALFVYSTRVGEAAPPARVSSDLALEAAWTVGPALILLFIAVPTVRTIFRTQPEKPAPDALVVTVVGHQWWWEFDYPGSGVVTANELHVPVGKTIRLQLKSADVIHSFWVPELGGKRDVVPGQINQITFAANTPGMYLGQCAEFCGLSHANMRLRVMVDTPDQFVQWQEAQRASPTLASAAGSAADGQTIFANSPCTSCHTVAGLSGGTLGPNLSHFGSRSSLAAGVLENTPHNVALWIQDPGKLKPGAQMPALGLRGDQLGDLVAYLESLK